MTEEWRDINTLLYSEGVNCRGKKIHYITVGYWKWGRRLTCTAGPNFTYW